MKMKYLFASRMGLLSTSILIVLLIPCSTLPAPVDFSIALESRLYAWKIFKKDLRVEDGEIWKAGDYSPIEEIESNSGSSIGPELELFLGNLFIRGFYIQGEYAFDVGDIKRTDAGVDLGIEYRKENLRFGIFAGWRNLDESLSGWKSLNIEEDDISGGGLGFSLRTSPHKSGLIIDLRALFGVGVISNYEKPTVVELRVDLGYRIDAIPLAINLGYGFWPYWRPTAEREGKHVEGQENLAHGPILKLAYTF